MGFIITVLTIMLALDGLWLWLSDRQLHGVREARAWRLANVAFVALQLLVLAWIFVGRWMNLHPGPPTVLTAAVLIWHLIVLPVAVVTFAILTIVQRIGRAFNSLFPVPGGEGAGEGPAVRRAEDRPTAQAGPDRRIHRGSTSHEPCPSPLPSPPGTWERETDAALPHEPVLPAESLVTRRSLLRTAAVMAPPLVTAVAAGASMPQLTHFQVRRITLDLPALPAALDGLSIAHVSDVHVGRFTRGPILDRIVRATNELNADLVLLTGDLINDSLTDLDAAIDLVKRLNPNHGLAMCEGNHDLIESRAEFERRVRDSGIPLLINESMTVRVRNEPIQLLGLRWGRATPGGTRRENSGDDAIASSMDATLRQLRGDAFPILLAHHPHAFDPAAAAGIPLTLAGHTHGGQLMLTDAIGFGPRMFRYWSGAYRTDGGAALVVSNGVGNWFPLRINAPAEIVHLTLRRGNGS